jgi:hypothetical protein
MADNHPRLVRNSKNVKCRGCGGVHNYLSRVSDDAACGTPIAFSPARALKMARLPANGQPDVMRIPDNEIVVMDNSARKLPRSGTGTVQLAQFSRVERSV